MGRVSGVDISTIAFVILSALTDGPRSPAEVRKLLETTYGWKRGSNAVYVMLKRFENWGFVYSKAEHDTALYYLSRQGAEVWKVHYDFYSGVLSDFSKIRKNLQGKGFSIAPARRRQRPGQAPEQRYPNANELKRIMKKANSQFASLLEASLITRRKTLELAAMQIESVNLKRGFAELPERSLSNAPIKNRRLQLDARIKKVLEKAIGTRSSGPVFLGKHGGAWTAENMSRMFKVCRNAAGVPEKVAIGGRGGRAKPS